MGQHSQESITRGGKSEQSALCSTDTVSDDHADCSGFRQSHHGDDTVVAAVLSMDVKVALEWGEDTHRRAQHLFSEAVWTVWPWIFSLRPVV